MAAIEATSEPACTTATRGAASIVAIPLSPVCVSFSVLKAAAASTHTSIVFHCKGVGGSSHRVPPINNGAVFSRGPITGMVVGPFGDDDGPDGVEEPLTDWNNNNVAPLVVGTALVAGFGILLVVEDLTLS